MQARQAWDPDPVAESAADADAEADADAQEPASRWSAKGRLGNHGLWVVACAAGLAASMLLLRLMASPQFAFDGGSGLAELGRQLQVNFTLAWVPHEHRREVLYLLLLPGAALMITLARLTFGLRVLGVRSVLMALAFSELGVLPSLFVIIAVVTTIGVLRPWMRRVRLPMYARMCLVLGITACLQLGFLFAGNALRSDLVWNLAFFPVIILAMIAEAIAASFEQNRLVGAVWRLGWTVAVALVIYLTMISPPYLDLLLHAPEVLLLQLAGIVAVAEFLDFRLLQDWQSRTRKAWAHLMDEEAEPGTGRGKRVVILRNRDRGARVGTLGPQLPRSHLTGSVKHLSRALRDRGYLVSVLEADIDVLRRLRVLLAPHPRTGEPGGIVLNMSTGTQGAAPPTQVPALLEMAGLAYVGPDPVGQALLSDRYALLSLWTQAGLTVPWFDCIRPGADEPAHPFPLLVGPRHWGSVRRRTVRSRAELERARAKFAQELRDTVVAESAAPGCVFVVAILGHAVPRFLPVLMTDPAGVRHCPAPVSDEDAQMLRDTAVRAFEAAGGRDFGCIRLQLERQPGARVVDSLSLPAALHADGPVATMLAAAGADWGVLLEQVVERAAHRCGVEWAHEVGPEPLQPAPAVEARG